MLRFVLSLILVTLTLLALATPALAGGWAAVVLDWLPVEVRAGQTLNLGFMVLQHAVRPVDDASPVLVATNAASGESLRVEARREGAAGHYALQVAFPSAGVWEWEIDPVPWGHVTHFEPLTVGPAEDGPAKAEPARIEPAATTAYTAPADAWRPLLPVAVVSILALGLALATRRGLLPLRTGVGIGLIGLIVGLAGLALLYQPTRASDSAPPAATGEQLPDAEPSPDTRDDGYGRALFVAKGCTSCHLSAISRSVPGPVIGPDLTSYRGDPEFVRRWLRDPQAVRPATQMPNYGLDAAEVETLVYFLDQGQHNFPDAWPALSLTPGALASDPPPTCPVTQPQDPPFVPPASFPAKAPKDHEFWYGSDALWTAVPINGRWGQLLFGDKMYWWREDYDWRLEPVPELTVTGRRLDGPAPPAASAGATNAVFPSTHSAMLSGVQVPTPGCWEITGRHADHALSFVVWVAP